MRIAVAGATGSIGRPVAEELAKRGHEVRSLSRHSAQYPVDLTTGAGLEQALDGCAVLIDASNAGPNEKQARAVLIEGGRRLNAAAAGAGVKHQVCISIVGCEQVPLPYYRVKVEQEQLARASEVPATVVRATQFHTLIAGLFESAARYRVLPGGGARLQPIDPRQVAEILAGIAEGPRRDGTVNVAGPEVLELGTLARTWKRVSGRSGLVVPTPLPPKLARPLKAGALTDAAPDFRGTVGFGEWLTRRKAAGA
jgi:uncharacterized protein YbjT (DUF2867 family)